MKLKSVKSKIALRHTHPYTGTSKSVSFKMLDLYTYVFVKVHVSVRHPVLMALINGNVK